VKEIQPFLENNKQSIEVQIPEGPLPIQGDHARLVQVVMNLLHNASKFTPEKERIRVHVEKDVDSLRVSVSDTGFGIKKEDLIRVFEPFAAIEKPTYIKGTGLGLSISRALVEAHGGLI
jgi:signal transduction histidine kinase